MENTIENAKTYFDELHNKPQPVFVPITTAGIMVAYADKITAEKDRTISDLRRQLSDCKAKARIGHNPDRT